MTRALLSAVLYVALSVLANPALANGLSLMAMNALRTGEMRKLAIHDAPVALPDIPVADMAGGVHHPASFKGKYMLVNFWATWCAPCRKEMPQLDALEGELGSDDFQVLLVAVGRNPPEAIQKFFGEAGITRLETLLDPKQALAAAAGVFGLPITLLLNRDGQEIARMRGDADWHSPEAVAFLTAVIAADQANGDK